MKTGIANLPLHYGQAPAWLFSRMKRLAREISIVIIKELGPDDFLEKLSDPFWFQAFGCVLGFDWHSSGLTTTVCGALKEGLKDISKEVGVFVCGGKGGISRYTPSEIEEIAQNRLISVKAEPLIYASKMSAKVDSCALQDGYQLYHHSFIFTKNGKWTVIQQGMNASTRWARRYHWLSSELKNLVCEPHKAICCDHKTTVLNMVAKESSTCRDTSTMISNNEPFKTIADFSKIRQLNLDKRHNVSLLDIKEKNFKKILEITYEQRPANFEKLLAIKGVGPKTIRALALISEIIYAKPASFKDPVRFSFAHGGKDGHPYPVDKKGYDLSIQILKDAVHEARLGRIEKMKAIKRLR